MYKGTLFDQPESVLCDREFWLQFAHFLTNDDKSDLTKGSTVNKALRRAMNLVKDKYGGKPEHHGFFSVMDDSNASARNNWLKGCCREVLVQKFKENTDSGKAAAEQATPIYAKHRRNVSTSDRWLLIVGY